MTLLSGADLFGIVGLVTLLSAFIANSFGKLQATARLYQAMNAVGSGILAVYSVLIQAWVFFPLEVVWAVVAAFALSRSYWATPAAKSG